MVLSIPLNTFVARYLKKLQEQQMKNRDSRTRLMSELLGNIKSVKLFAWEASFIKKVLGVRNDKELRMLRKIGIVTALNTTMWTGIPGGLFPFYCENWGLMGCMQCWLRLARLQWPRRRRRVR